MTIAYSDKYDLWTTRYSFEPTCYANVGNTLLSSKGTGLYKHDVNELRCRFYGVNEGCSLEVASNQDPSAIKSFNSISLETNTTNWTAEVFCNDEYQDRNKQQGTTNNFVSKEGFQYADMPRSALNSTRNVFPVMQLIQSVEGAGNPLTAYNVTLFDDASTFIPSSDSPKYRAYLLSDGALVDLVEGIPLYVTLAQTKFLQLTSFSGTIPDPPASLSQGQLVVVSDSSIDGDQMRGPYARIKLTTSTTEPLELHAVNVDYSFSKLDSRLGQNRGLETSATQKSRSNSPLSQNR